MIKYIIINIKPIINQSCLNRNIIKSKSKYKFTSNCKLILLSKFNYKFIKI